MKTPFQAHRSFAELQTPSASAASAATCVPKPCGYLEHNLAGKLVACGEPATCRGRRMHYCDAHKSVVWGQCELFTLDGVSLGKPVKWFNKKR